MTLTPTRPPSATIDRASFRASDFRRLWLSFAISEFGVAISAGAVLVVAINELSASTAAVSVMIGAAGIVAALASLPAGPIVEHRRKRPVLIGADIGRFLVVAAIPVLVWLDALTLASLGGCVVLLGVLSIVHAAASGAHLKALVTPDRWQWANARLEATRWAMVAVVTPIGGVLVTLLGATVTLSIDAISYLIAAVVVRSIRGRESRPSVAPGGSRLRQIPSGWVFIAASRPLRALFVNAMLFGGCVIAVGPVLAVFVLRDLGLPVWQYGLVLGLPALGGALGSSLSGRVVGRLGARRTLLWFGVLRASWMILLPASADPIAAFCLILFAEFALMVCAGVFNPVFATVRFGLVDDDHMARVSAAWATTARFVQPLFAVLGGVAAGSIGVRPTIVVIAIVLLASGFLLPWRSLEPPGPIDSTPQ